MRASPPTVRSVSQCARSATTVRCAGSSNRAVRRKRAPRPLRTLAEPTLATSIREELAAVASRDEQRRSPSEPQRGADGDHRRRSGVHGLDDLAAVDALEVDAGDAEVAVSELALHDDQRDAFAGHLDGVGVPKLVWGEAAPDSCGGRGTPQLGACRG